MIANLIATLVQLGVFIFIPYIAFIFRRNRSETFTQYIGLYTITPYALALALGASVLFTLAAIGLGFFSKPVLVALQSPQNLVGSIRGLAGPVEAIFLILVFAWIKTGLSEEIFFRGFLGKRLINRFGLSTGNTVQAIVFAGVHLFLFSILIPSAWEAAIVAFVLYAVAGWVAGYINERHASGSMLPGWIAHGLGNTMAFLLVDFVL